MLTVRHPEQENWQVWRSLPPFVSCLSLLCAAVTVVHGHPAGGTLSTINPPHPSPSPQSKLYVMGLIIIIMNQTVCVAMETESWLAK